MERYEELFKEFSRRVEEYRSLGINPFSLATGCAVKVDLVTVLYPAIRSIKGELEKLGMSIAPRRDADIFPGSIDGFRLHREIYRSEEDVDPERLGKISPSRAIVLAQVYQRIADNPDSLAKVVRSIYSRVAQASPGIVIGKGHSIVTADPKAQFMLFDYIKVERGDGKLVVGNNDTIQIIDPAEDPGSPRQAAVALGNSLNDLYTLGASRNAMIVPVIDSPSKELRRRIEDSMRIYAERVGARIIDAPQPEAGALLMGATVFAETDRKPPFFYDHVSPGMELLVTRPIGELASINVYMMSMLDREIAEELKKRSGIDVEKLLEIKNRIIDAMARPNIEVARIIEKRLPHLDEDYDPERHIAATTDVTGPGIYVIKELAELSKTSIRIEKIPLLSPELSEFATRNYIIPNATAGTNGAIVIIAKPRVIDEIEGELREKGEEPIRIGRVIAKGETRVAAPSTLKKYIAAKAYLKEFDLYEA
ncbi:MAG: SelD-related putative sulfur metabolism protein [Sulfolobales archaeon]